MAHNQRIAKEQVVKPVVKIPKPTVADTTSRSPVRSPADSLQRITANPDNLSHADIFQLQRALGNRTVGNMLARSSQTQPVIQPKLTINAPGDKYEQEADKVAKQITQQPLGHQKNIAENKKPAFTNLSGLSRSDDGAFFVGSDFEQQLRMSQVGGQSLPTNLKSEFSYKFGRDFSSVKIHTDSQADQFSHVIQAKAFTTGNNIYFRQGFFQPENQEGKELLAHELSHVIQQDSELGSNGEIIERKLSNLNVDQDLINHSVQQSHNPGCCCKGCANNALVPTKSVSSNQSKSQIIQRDPFPTPKEREEIAEHFDYPTEAWIDKPGGGDKTEEDKKSKNRKTFASEIIAGMQGTILIFTGGDKSLSNWENKNKMQATKPLKDYTGPANAAKNVVDRKLGSWAVSAAPHRPKHHDIQAGKNLHLASEEDTRSKTSYPIDLTKAAGFAYHMSDDCRKLAKASNFHPDRSNEERQFFEQEILKPILSIESEGLQIIHQFGAYFGDFKSGNIYVQNRPDFSTYNKTGTPLMDFLFDQWLIFLQLTHEYIHTLQHPNAFAVPSAVMLEGFCEFFTRVVLGDPYSLSAALPERNFVEGKVQSDKDYVDVISYVETDWKDFIGDPYVYYLTQAKAIESKVGVDAMKDAYFKGEVEKIGFMPSGKLVDLNKNAEALRLGVNTKEEAKLIKQKVEALKQNWNAASLSERRANFIKTQNALKDYYQRYENRLPDKIKIGVDLGLKDWVTIGKSYM